MIRRFGWMHPRSLAVTDAGALSFQIAEGAIRPLTSHGIEMEFECVPGELAPDSLRTWANYQEFPNMLLPSTEWIQGTGAWDGGFLGDVRSLRDRTEENSELRDHWREDYVFTPRTPGWRNYGERTIPIEGNAHGPGAQMSGAFDRFVVMRQRDRFLQAEEMAIALMESRSIILDGIELTPDSGYEAYHTWFDYPLERTEDRYPDNGWSDPVEGRMWDAGHRGMFALTEFYYLTGSRRAADAFHHLTLSSRYINLREPSLALGSRTAGYFWTQYARHYSIFRDPTDLVMIMDNWDRTRTHQLVDGNEAFKSMHPSGVIVSFAPYEDYTGFPPGGSLTKLIFQNVLMQSYYDVFQLTGFESARDLLYSSGKWQMRIYRNLGLYEPPNYEYRPWLEEAPDGSNADGGNYFWGAQNFPGLALYYHLFGDHQARQILDRADQVYWTGQTAGFASAIAFATDQTKPDHLPPPPVTELAFVPLEGGKVQLTWRNVEDAANLQIKFTTREGPIQDLHAFEDTHGVAWWEMESVAEEPAPTGPGTLQSMDITLSGAPSTYRFAMKSQDAWGNISALSVEGRMEGSDPAPSIPDPDLPPVAIVGAPQTVVLQEGITTATVILDGGASYDPENSALNFEWTGNPNPDDTSMPALNLSAGTYAFVLRVRDEGGQWSLPVEARVQVVGRGGPIDPTDPPDPVDPPEPDELPEPPPIVNLESFIQSGPESSAPWRDALISELQDPNANLGGLQLADLYAEDGGGQQRLVIWFPIPELSDHLVLERAELQMTQMQVQGEPPLPMSLNIHALLESWIEGRGMDPWSPGTGVGWMERDLGMAWSTPGGSFDAEHWITMELPAENDQSVLVDITSLVQIWYQGTIPNHGLIIVPVSGYWVAHGLHARESDDTDSRPWVRLYFAETTSQASDYQKWVEDLGGLF